MTQEIYNNLSLQEGRFALLLADRCSKAEQVRVGKALDAASRMYEGVVRNDGQPHIIHHIRTANILLEHGETNSDLIIAALLKGTIEARGYTLSEINDLYGTSVAELVTHIHRALPDDSEHIEEIKRTINPKQYRWYATEASQLDCILKSAEIIDNIRCWEFILPNHPSRDKFIRWCDEATTFFGAIVQKAGVGYADTYSDIIAEYQTMPQFHDYLQPIDS